MSDHSGGGILLKKTAGGAGWTIGWRGATRAIGLVSTLVLARVLVPADFGLVALAMSFSKSVDILADLGVQEALIRETKPDKVMYDTAFTINACRGLITAAVLGLSAVPFAAFFGDPRLTYVVLALTVAVLLDAFENVGVSDFRRHLAFHREFQLSILPRLAQFVVTIVLALTWHSYWALVAGILTSRVLLTLASYVMHPYRPGLTLRAWNRIIGFSFWTWMIGMAQMIRGRGVVMIIGGMLNPTSLGVYSVGAEVAALPETELIGPLCRVCFASFAAARRDGLAVSMTYLRIVSCTLIIALPAAIGISAVAAPLVSVALGPKWLLATRIIEILSIAGLFTVIGRVSWTLLSAFALLSPLFWFGLAITIFQFVLLALALSYWGITGAALATGATILIEQATYSLMAVRKFAIPVKEILVQTWRCLTATAVMATFLWQTGLGWVSHPVDPASGALQLFTATATGAVVYGITLVALWLLCGRPPGAERDTFVLLKRSVGTVWRRLALRLG